MSECAPNPQGPPPSDDATPDPSVLRAERRLCLLAELAEIGMELARALKPPVPADGAAVEAPDGAAATDRGRGKSRDPADAFAGLSRAIRLTLALEARTDEELRDLKSGVVRERADARARTAEDAKAAADNDRAARKARVRELVMTVADAEIEDVCDYDDLSEALDERLTEDEAYCDLNAQPLREIVERLCKDLVLTPDWSRWTGEGWMKDGAPVRPRCSVFNRTSARPVDAEDPEPEAAPGPGCLQGAHHLE